MKIWIVIYEHKYGADCWPVTEKPTIEEVKERLRAEGSWDEDDELGEQSHLEIRGPWTVHTDGTVMLPPSCWPVEQS